MNETIKKQILAIRDTELTNMFDVNMVQRLCLDRGYYEAVSFIADNKEAYCRFIMFGEEK